MIYLDGTSIYIRRVSRAAILNVDVNSRNNFILNTGSVLTVSFVLRLNIYLPFTTDKYQNRYCEQNRNKLFEMDSSELNTKFLLAVVHEYLQRKDGNLANVFKSKCNSVR